MTSWIGLIARMCEDSKQKPIELTDPLDALKASDYERVCNEMPNVAYLLNDVLRGSKRQVEAMRDNGPTT